MSDRWWVAAFVYPAPLYAGLFVLVHFWAGSLGFPIGFALAVGFGSATGFGLVRRPVVVWGGRVFFLLAILVPIAYFSSTSGEVLDFTSGVMLGAPFLWLEYAWRDSAGPGARAIALESTLLAGVLELATLDVTLSSPVASAGGQFLQALGQVVLGQAQGIAALLTGMTPSSMPLETTLDIVFVGLGSLALAGVLVSWAAPRTALDEPLPWSWNRPRPSPAPGAPLDEALALRDGQREALATRTLPQPPPTMLAPGSGSLLVASLCVIGFLAVAVTAPTFAVLALVLGAVAGVAAVAVVLSRRLTPLGGLAT